MLVKDTGLLLVVICLGIRQQQQEQSPLALPWFCCDCIGFGSFLSGHSRQLCGTGPAKRSG
jgi:hypothetical protein